MILCLKHGCQRGTRPGYIEVFFPIMGFAIHVLKYQVWTTLMNLIALQSRNLHITDQLSNNIIKVNTLPLTRIDFTSMSYKDVQIKQLTISNEMAWSTCVKIFDHRCMMRHYLTIIERHWSSGDKMSQNTARDDIFWVLSGITKR